MQGTLHQVGINAYERTDLGSIQALADSEPEQEEQTALARAIELLREAQSWLSTYEEHMGANSKWYSTPHQRGLYAFKGTIDAFLAEHDGAGGGS